MRLSRYGWLQAWSLVIVLLLAACGGEAPAPAKPSAASSSAASGGAISTSSAATTTSSPSKAAASSAAATSASSAESSAAAGEKVFKFGLVMPLTGSNASYGKDQVLGTEFGVEDLNAKGGVNGMKLQVVEEDSQADPKRGVSAFDKVVDVDKVNVVVSAWSSVIMAMAPRAEQKNVLLLSDGSSAPEIEGAGKTTMSIYPLGSVDQPALATYAYKTLNKRKAGMIYISNDTGRLPAAVFKKKWLELGGQVVAEEQHAPDAIDFKAQLAKIKAANPDLLYMMSLTKESPIIVKQARELGIDAQVVSYSAIANEQFVKQGGQGAIGAVFTSMVPPLDTPEVKAFVERFKAKAGHDPAGLNYVLYLYNAPNVLAKGIDYAMKKNWELTPENLKKALIEVKEFELPYVGKLTMLPSGTVVAPVTIMQVQPDGTFKALTVMQYGSY